MEALVVIVAALWRTWLGGDMEALAVLMAGVAVWKTWQGHGYSPLTSPYSRQDSMEALVVLVGTAWRT